MRNALIALFVLIHGALAIAKAPISDLITSAEQLQNNWPKFAVQSKRFWSEALGEAGGTCFAKEQGWLPLFLRPDASMAQGPDQIFIDNQGLIHILECKGGASPLGFTFGYRQGTIEWAIKSAENVYRTTSSFREQQSMANVLLAAKGGRLEVHVLRTTYDSGIPNQMILESTARQSDDAIRLAESVVDDLVRDGYSIFDDVAQSYDNIGGAVLSRRSGQSLLNPTNHIGESIDDVFRSSDEAVGALSNTRTGRYLDSQADEIVFYLGETVDDASYSLAGRISPTPGTYNHNAKLYIVESSDDVAWTLGTTFDDAVYSIDDAGRFVAATSLSMNLHRYLPIAITVIAVAGIAYDGYQRINEIQIAQDRYMRGEISFQECEVIEIRSASGFVGGITGALAGAKIGAISGGMLGSLIPFVGNTWGVVIGTIAGAVTGYIGGEALCQRIGDWTINQVHSRGHTITLYANNMSEWTTTTWNSSGETLINLWSGVEECTNWCGFRLNQLGGNIQHGAEETYLGIGRTYKWTSNGIQNTSHDTVVYWQSVFQ